MIPKRECKRQVRALCHLLLGDASAGALYRQTNAGLGLEDGPQADVRGM